MAYEIHKRDDGAVKVPAEMLRALGLVANATATLTLDNGWLLVGSTSGTRPRYTAAELVAQCDLSAPESPEAQAWRDAAPVGREIR